jgi:hypothetical protein
VNPTTQPQEKILAGCNVEARGTDRCVAVFVKSDRLSSFLLYICERALTGRDDEINESSIGADLFNQPNYDPASDGLVRSHASRLRQRLEQYFSEDGAQEPIRLIIPKGGYIRRFQTQVPTLELSESATPESLWLPSKAASSDQKSSPAPAAIPLSTFWLPLFC